MAHYFTREEAEALLPQISVVLRNIQESRGKMQQSEEELGALRLQAMGNGHHLPEGMMELQKELARHIQTLQMLDSGLKELGCEWNDADSGLRDFLSQRDRRDIYL